MFASAVGALATDVVSAYSADTPPAPIPQAGGLDALRSDPAALKQAVVFASAVGALTTTKKGAIGAQPSYEESHVLFESAKAWYNFW